MLGPLRTLDGVRHN